MFSSVISDQSCTYLAPISLSLFFFTVSLSAVFVFCVGSWQCLPNFYFTLLRLKKKSLFRWYMFLKEKKK